MSTSVLNKSAVEIESLFDRILSTPKVFAESFYIEKGGFLSPSTKASPYLTLESREICCIIQSARPMEGDPIICSSFLTKIKKDDPNKRYFKMKTPDGIILFIKAILIDTLGVQYSDTPPVSTKHINPSQIAECYPEISNYRYLGSDRFTNTIFVSSIVDRYYDYYKPGIKGYFKLQGATICQGAKGFYGTTIHDHAEENLEEYLTTSTYQPTIKAVLLQVVANLDFLQRVGFFNHGDLKPSNVMVIPKASSFSYEGVTWNADFELKLVDFDKASITALSESLSIRVYNRHPLADIYLNIAAFTPVTGLIDGHETYLVEDTTNPQLLSRIRYMGVPYYPSFDTYTIVVGLLLIPAFNNLFFQSPIFVAVFVLMWTVSEVSIVRGRIANAISSRKPPTYGNIIGILKGIHLRCDITEVLWLAATKIPDEIPQVVKRAPIAAPPSVIAAEVPRVQPAPAKGVAPVQPVVQARGAPARGAQPVLSNIPLPSAPQGRRVDIFEDDE